MWIKFTFALLLFLSIFDIILNAQEYSVEVAVCDTISSNLQYSTPCPNGSLEFILDSTFVPYVTGLTFQVEITGVNGVVLSNVVDTVKVGDNISLPAPNELGILEIIVPKIDDSFIFLTKLVGIPQIDGERYYCNLYYSMTAAACHNRFDIYSEDDSLCTVQPSLGLFDNIKKGPTEFILNQNYPNPFNLSTTISYSISSSNFVNLTIYNVLGKEIKPLVSEFQLSGRYSVYFNAEKFTSGIYFYKLGVGNNFSITKKMLLLR